MENFFGTNPGVLSGGLVAGAVSGNTFTSPHPQNANPASELTASYQRSKDLASFFAGGAADGAGTTVTFTTQTIPFARLHQGHRHGHRNGHP